MTRQAWRSWRTTHHAPGRRLCGGPAQAGNGWGRTGRAQAWHQAGLMARRHGMEIMGYEEDPDYAVYDGSYTYGAGRNYFLWTQEHGNAIPATPAQRAEAALPGPYVTQQERERYAASEARPYARFHYRQIAASHMMKRPTNCRPARRLTRRCCARARASSSTTRRTSRRKCTGAMWKPAPSCHSAAALARNARNPTSRARPGSTMSRPGGLGTAAPRSSGPPAGRRPAGAGGRRRGRCAVGLARAARRLSRACVRPRGRTPPLSGPAPRPAAMPHPFSPGRARPPAATAASWPRPARAGAGRVRSQPCR